MIAHHVEGRNRSEVRFGGAEEIRVPLAIFAPVGNHVAAEHDERRLLLHDGIGNAGPIFGIGAAIAHGHEPQGLAAQGKRRYAEGTDLLLCFTVRNLRRVRIPLHGPTNVCRERIALHGPGREFRCPKAMHEAKGTLPTSSGDLQRHIGRHVRAAAHREIVRAGIAENGLGLEIEIRGRQRDERHGWRRRLVLALFRDAKFNFQRVQTAGPEQFWRYARPCGVAHAFHGRGHARAVQHAGLDALR